MEFFTFHFTVGIEGSITVLNFPTKSHLLSASEDGTICLYHTRDWAVLSTLRGHKGRVNAVAVHPSSKICLSVGKDRVLRMWDLMRGKGSASVKLGKGASRIDGHAPDYADIATFAHIPYIKCFLHIYRS
jgi:WD40 repeat protein